MDSNVHSNAARALTTAILLAGGPPIHGLASYRPRRDVCAEPTCHAKLEPGRAGRRCPACRAKPPTQATGIVVDLGGGSGIGLGTASEVPAGR